MNSVHSCCNCFVSASANANMLTCYTCIIKPTFREVAVAFKAKTKTKCERFYSKQGRHIVAVNVTDVSEADGRR